MGIFCRNAWGTGVVQSFLIYEVRSNFNTLSKSQNGNCGRVIVT